MKTYAAIYDDEIRKDSSSGGVFSLIASRVLKNNGSIYGVAMTDDCYSAEFVRVVDKNDLAKLRGSKYFQAKMNNTFKLVKKDLQDGIEVLFSGTGCQINGLKLFLGREYTNLTCVDVICHGVPSPALWKKYAVYQEEQHGKLQSVNFRCKDDSWQNFGMKENQLYISMDKDSFMRMFLRDYCLRPSCYKCIAKEDKKSDITIADFWGIDNVAPEMNDEHGTSLVIVRTDKGTELFESIKDKLKMKEVSYEEGVKSNPSDYKSVRRPKQRDTFFDDMNSLTFPELEEKYAADIKIAFSVKVKRKIKSMFRKISGGTIHNNISWNNYGLLFSFEKIDENN